MPARPTMMPPVGKSGPLMWLHQALDVDVLVVDVRVDRVDHLDEVVRRDVRRHPDRDPGRPVHEQVGEARGKDQRLLARLVVIGGEVDRVRVDVPQHLRREPREPRFGVPHRGRRVVVDRAEVPLPVDERVAHREVLCEAHERVVDRLVSVGVVVTHHVADHACALAVGAGRLETGLVHRVEHATMDWLEAVANVGQRPADDHAHRVIHVRGAHLLA